MRAMMEGSLHEGERENARYALEAELARLGMTWADLAELLKDPPPGARDARPDAHEQHPFDNLAYAPVALIEGLIERYVALDAHQRLAVALWAIHTHVYDRYMVTPRVVLTSPVRGCGKTTLLDVLGRLVASPQRSDNITAASIYHHTDNVRGTLLLDEADNLDLGTQHAMRAVLNAGHRRGGTVTRMARGEPRHFAVFAPVAFASIGTLSLPLMSRAIVIHMVRHDGSQPLARLDTADPADIDAVYSYTKRWLRAQEQDSTISADPAMPPELRNRHADNWRALIAIADACGPDWGAKARAAAVALSPHQDEDVAITLLRDIHRIFDERGTDRILSRTLVDDLVAMPDAEWGEYRGPQGAQQPRRLTTGALSAALRPFKLRPRTIWPPNRTAEARSGKGYLRRDFEPVWRSYCSDPGTQQGEIRHLTDKGERVA
jgi:hypothetical protein